MITPNAEKPRRPFDPATKLPRGVEAICFICRREFKTDSQYRRHRNMDVPFPLRTCSTYDWPRKETQQ